MGSFLAGCSSWLSSGSARHCDSGAEADGKDADHDTDSASSSANSDAWDVTWTLDEDADSLGESLRLPPWLEASRASIARNLPALRTTSRPVGVWIVVCIGRATQRAVCRPPSRTLQ